MKQIELGWLIRYAAVGPTPRLHLSLESWVKDGDAWVEVWQRMSDVDFQKRMPRWRALSETEKRMFLLMVAESIEE